MKRLLLALILLSSPALACTSADGLPDTQCTPGATDPRVTQENIHETICVPGYSKGVRPPVGVTSRIKRERMAAYRLEGADPRDLELDHLISLELGGDPRDSLNLWPEPRNGALNAHVKDAIENRLHRLVCQDRMQLAEAQRRISSDWVHALDGFGQ